MKTPICWKSFVFTHVQSDDRVDHYQGDTFPGRLRHERSQNLWLASLRDAKAVSYGGADYHHDDQLAARAALDGAAEVLRRRVAEDQAWLDKLAQEIG